jgi:hypothetical protein
VDWSGKANRRFSSATRNAVGNVAFAGSGNNYSLADTRSDSLFAVDLETGELLWNAQMAEQDRWAYDCITCGPDHDFGTNPLLFEHAGREHAWRRRSLRTPKRCSAAFNLWAWGPALIGYQSATPPFGKRDRPSGGASSESANSFSASYGGSTGTRPRFSRGGR